MRGLDYNLEGELSLYPSLLVRRRDADCLSEGLVGKLSRCYFTLLIEQTGRDVPSRTRRRRRIVNDSKLGSRSSIRVHRKKC